MPNLLENKVAIVTGSGRGVGKGVALQMAAEGAKVVVVDPGVNLDGSGADQSVAEQVAAEIRENGGEAVACQESVATMEGGETIVQTAIDAYGKLDAVVTCHGILRDRMIFNMSEQEWDDVIAVHLKGTFTVIKHACILFRQQRSGRVVTFSSTSGLYGNSGQANYGAAKDGIAGFTRVVARDMGRYGVTANSIAPSAQTRMIGSVPDEARDLRAARGMSGGNVGGLRGEPEDVAPFVTWLASDEAAHVNGHVFYVTEGLVSLLNEPEPVRTMHKDGRWTVEEIIRVFPATLGGRTAQPGADAASGGVGVVGVGWPLKNPVFAKETIQRDIQEIYMYTAIATPKALFQKDIRYTIPTFQRPYVWSQDDQWEPLWEDVRNLAENYLEALDRFDNDSVKAEQETKAHFLGAVVLQQVHTPAKEIEQREVIDGQQRVTTLQLLLDAIQEVCEEGPFRATARRLSKFVTNDEELVGDETHHRFKLWPTRGDREAFTHAMENGLAVNAFEHSLIVQAHDFFQEQIRKWLDGDIDQKTSRVDALETAVTVLLQMVVIDLDPNDEPNVIFETLNARGTPLQQSDLIKNFVLSHYVGNPSMVKSFGET